MSKELEAVSLEKALVKAKTPEEKQVVLKNHDKNILSIQKISIRDYLMEKSLKFPGDDGTSFSTELVLKIKGVEVSTRATKNTSLGGLSNAMGRRAEEHTPSEACKDARFTRGFLEKTLIQYILDSQQDINSD